MMVCGWVIRTMLLAWGNLSFRREDRPTGVSAACWPLRLVTRLAVWVAETVGADAKEDCIVDPMIPDDALNRDRWFDFHTFAKWQHEALRIQLPQNGPQHKNAATRIAYLFMELLERQFPIDNTEQPLRLRTAQDFAGSLAVHINYLNRAVKEVTGKPTTVHIAERIAAEAKALLLYTD
jgi:hypothetical protein